MQYIGELAALFTSFCWSLSAVGFTMAGKIFDSTTINRIRVSLAFLALLVINFLVLGQALPLNASLDRWGWLTLSGIVGLAIGDFFLFRSYQLVGPRIGLLLLSLAPVFSTFIAWLFFGEHLTLLEIGGIAVTLAGIGWVVLSKSTTKVDEEPTRLSTKGLLFGAFAALGQATGLILSKQGMAGDFSPCAGTIIRLNAAIIFLWIAAILQKNATTTFQRAKQEPASFGWVAFGAFFGPVIGVSASLFSIQHANIGIASTLMALPPVFMLPISYFFFHERFGWQAVVGTLLAISGVAILLVI